MILQLLTKRSLHDIIKIRGFVQSSSSDKRDPFLLQDSRPDTEKVDDDLAAKDAKELYEVGDELSITVRLMALVQTI